MSRKRATFEPAVPSSMDAKHASLMQDYLQLQDEFVAINDRLNISKMKKATLLSEVRFLRRRLKKLKEAPPNPRENWTIPSSPTTTAKCGRPNSGAIAPEPSTVSPKNNLLASTEIPAIWEPVRLVSALKTSVFRTKPSEFITAIPGKRKISWQDQICLQCK